MSSPFLLWCAIFLISNAKQNRMKCSDNFPQFSGASLMHQCLEFLITFLFDTTLCSPFLSNQLLAKSRSQSFVENFWRGSNGSTNSQRVTSIKSVQQILMIFDPITTMFDDFYPGPSNLLVSFWTPYFS